MHTSPAFSRARPGFLLVEVLLGIAVFVLFMGAVGMTIMSSQVSSRHAGDMGRANQYAEQALEVARSIRDGAGLSALVPGNHGYALDAAGHWILTGTSFGTGGYTTVLSLYTIDAHTVRATADTEWYLLPSRPGKVVLTTEITDDTSTSAQLGDWTSIQLKSSCAGGSACGSTTLPANPKFRRVAVTGTFAYVASATSGGGDGLQIFDVSDVTNPKYVASFSLGSSISGIDLAFRGNTLYILTDDPGEELRAYDVTSPIVPTLLNWYDIPGSAVATALAIQGDRLYVGLNGSPLALHLPAAPRSIVGKSPSWFARVTSSLLALFTRASTVASPTKAFADCYDASGNPCGPGINAYTCTSPLAWPGITLYVPASILSNASVVKCVEQCVESNPRRHNYCSAGLFYPFCVRPPNDSQIINTQTETAYLQSHYFGNGESWNSGDNCNGQCNPPPGETSTLCDASQTPFVFEPVSNGWVPNCFNGTCQEPPFTQADQGNTKVLCGSDVRMTQCGQEPSTHTVYGFVPDGGPCDADTQCYHGSDIANWRPYASTCVSHVCTAQGGGSSSSAACVPLGSNCRGHGGGTCCAGLICQGICRNPPPSGQDFYSFDISDPHVITYLSAVTVGGVDQIALSGTAAFLATPDTAHEMAVVNITNPAAMVLQGQKNLQYSTAARSVWRTGTAAIIGTDNMPKPPNPDGNPEIALFDVGDNQVPDVSDAGLPQEGSGGIIDMRTDSHKCYAFTATGWQREALQIFKLNGLISLNPLTHFPKDYSGNPPTTGKGRGLFYDIPHDRLYLVTDTGFYIFAPGAATGGCP